MNTWIRWSLVRNDASPICPIFPLINALAALMCTFSWVILSINNLISNFKVIIFLNNKIYFTLALAYFPFCLLLSPLHIICSLVIHSFHGITFCGWSLIFASSFIQCVNCFSFSNQPWSPSIYTPHSSAFHFFSGDFRCEMEKGLWHSNWNTKHWCLGLCRAPKLPSTLGS